jgi:hypothetical protein
MFNNFVKSLTSQNEYSNLVLRKTKSFNKSRYSRNRQYYRTGVYWCLWLNIILVFALYYAFYRYTLKFGYVFIIYVVGMLLGLLSYFSKNYFLGLANTVFTLVESILYDFILYCYELRLSLLIILNKATIVTKRLINKWK